MTDSLTFEPHRPALLALAYRMLDEAEREPHVRKILGMAMAS